ncbi:MAG: HEAT repeat domain-containing protein, partial [Gemmatimonadaceae bacterium]
MIAAWVFAVIAIVQAGFILLLVLFLTIRRRYDRTQRAAFRAARAALDVPLRNWIVAGAHADPVVRALRALPRTTAIGYVSLLARQTIPAAQRDELAEALRGETWVRRAVGQRDSRFWWRRLEAARALSIVGTGDDRDAVSRLLRDEHPAVQIAAASALPRVADPVLLDEVLDGLFTYPKVLRHYLTTVLRATPGAIGPALARRIRVTDEAVELAAQVALAGALDAPEAITASLAHADHPDAMVRRAVARTLARHPDPESARALAVLVRDHAPSVRAAAATSLGELGAGRAAPVLAPLLADPAWMVRLRAALALAQVGERGRGG